MGAALEGTHHQHEKNTNQIQIQERESYYALDVFKAAVEAQRRPREGCTPRIKRETLFCIGYLGVGTKSRRTLDPPLSTECLLELGTQYYLGWRECIWNLRFAMFKFSSLTWRCCYPLILPQLPYSFVWCISFTLYCRSHLPDGQHRNKHCRNRGKRHQVEADCSRYSWICWRCW